MAVGGHRLHADRGRRVATEPAGENHDSAGPRVWLVNFSNARGPAIAFAFEPASEVRSFAIPPLSTSLASGTVAVTPYVSGTGLAGTPETLVFAGTDLDVWASAFLDAMDLVLSPDVAPAAQELSRADDRIADAKRALATTIAGRVQYVLAGGGPGEHGLPDPRRDAAIAAMERSLLVALANAYAIESVVQAAVDITSPYTDPFTAPHLFGKATLTQPGTSIPVRNASLSTGTVPLAKTAPGAPALASFLLTVQAPASERRATVRIEYEVVKIERPRATDLDGDQFATWLTLVYRPDAVHLDGVTLAIPLRAYPQPPSLLAQDAKASFAAPVGPEELVRWDAHATWTHEDAAQDEIALQFELGTANAGAQSRILDAPSTGALFAALAQFVTVWPALSADLAQPASRVPGAPPNPASAGALAAMASMATALAAAWPANAIVPQALDARELMPAAEIVHGTYSYTLARPADDNPDLSTMTIVAAAANPTALWPEFSVDAGDGTGMRALNLQSSTRGQAVYQYPSGIRKGTALTYQVILPKLDVVVVSKFTLSASIVRNEHLVDGAATSPLFVYRTPYTGFAAPVIPLLLVDEDVDIGSGSVQQLHAALQSFLRGLLDRPDAPAGSQRALRVAVSYGEELSADPAAGGAGGLVAKLPIALIPSMLLTVNGDDRASIDAFARDVAELVVAWDAQAKPSRANAALFFDISLFLPNASSANTPQLVARSVRYALS